MPNLGIRKKNSVERKVERGIVRIKGMNKQNSSEMEADQRKPPRNAKDQKYNLEDQVVARRVRA